MRRGRGGGNAAECSAKNWVLCGDSYRGAGTPLSPFLPPPSTPQKPLLYLIEGEKLLFYLLPLRVRALPTKPELHHLDAGGVRTTGLAGLEGRKTGTATRRLVGGCSRWTMLRAN